MGIYQLKTCKEEDKASLIDFLRNHWQEDHVFVKSDALFRFQHYNSEKKEYSFILGWNILTNQIDGVIGLIPVSQFDPALAEYNDTWGGIWKVRPDVKNEEIGTLGMRLFGEFNAFVSHGSLGMSKVATKLHAMMQYNSCVLSQYYVLNPEFTDFRIAYIPLKKNLDVKISVKSDFTIKNIKDIQDIREGQVFGVYYPMKSLTYFRNRFQNHPIYDYEFWGIYDLSKTLRTIFVTRTTLVNSNRVIRIVDVFGSLEGLGSLKRPLEDLCIEEGAEYIDIMNHGISESVFEELGFEHLDVEGATVIPNYFEPFIQQNITIYCAYRGHANYVMFKGDSDQDRPNIIK